MYVCMHVCLCVCVYVCMCVCMYVFWQHNSKKSRIIFQISPPPGGASSNYNNNIASNRNNQDVFFVHSNFDSHNPRSFLYNEIDNKNVCFEKIYNKYTGDVASFSCSPRGSGGCSGAVLAHQELSEHRESAMFSVNTT